MASSEYFIGGHSILMELGAFPMPDGGDSDRTRQILAQHFALCHPIPPKNSAKLEID